MSLIEGLPVYQHIIVKEIIRDLLKHCIIIYYYINENTTLSFSKFSQLSVIERTNKLIEMATAKNFYIDLIAYCLLPNHFHLVVRQIKEKGIQLVVGNLINSYTKAFNLKHQRKSGPLYQGRFRAVRIETEEKLLHVVRYIHLNPYTNYLVKDLDDLKNYQYSSLPIYLDQKKDYFFKSRYY